jgi:hypothetical protein
MMQMTLTFDSTTIDLMGSGCQVMDNFAPATASADDESVIDTIEVLYRGTAAAGRTLLQGINRLLEMARRNVGKQKNVYLNFALDGSDTLYRTRVLDGMVTLDKKLTLYWKNDRVRFTLHVEHVPYWEGAETTLPLTNGNGTDVTTGINVYLSCADATGSSPNKRDNWVKINDEDVEGDLLAPLYMDLDVASVLANGLYINKLWIGLFPDHLMDGQPMHNIETFSDTGVTATSDTDASGGTYYAIPITASETKEAGFVFTNLEYMRSSYFRLFLRTFKAAPDGMWIQIRIKTTGGYVGETPWVQVVSTSEDVSIDHTRIYDLGMVKLPPMSGIDGYTTMTGEVWCYVSGSGTLNLDAIQIISADYYSELGCANRTSYVGSEYDSTPPVYIHCRLIEQYGEQPESYSKWQYYRYDPPLVYDGFQFFTEHVGNGLYVTPGVDNYLNLIMRAPVSKWNTVAQYGQLILKYRPRRRNI